MSLNRVSLMGYIGKVPQFYQTAEGDSYARFSLATQERWKDANGQKQTCTDWHSIVVFSRTLVEILSQYGGKGAYVFVEGKLNHRTLLTEEGRHQRMTEVLLKDYRGTLRILNKGKASGSPDEDEREDAPDREEKDHEL